MARFQEALRNTVVNTRYKEYSGHDGDKDFISEIQINVYKGKITYDVTTEFGEFYDAVDIEEEIEYGLSEEEINFLSKIIHHATASSYSWLSVPKLTMHTESEE